MTRINTNVASLRGLRSLNKANDLLGTSLTRLSTGLKINQGKDSPAGLIASETLRSQITTIEQSIKNSNRANNVIATADSALGEIGGLLNQIRGLVQEGLNEGALSTAEIEANQLQIDAALSAINRISANTTFAGDKLIDGSKAFTTQITAADKAKLTDFKVNEAIFGSNSTVEIDATVTSAAEKASLNYAGGTLGSQTTLEVAGSKGQQVLFLGGSSTVSNIRDAVNSVSDVTGVTGRIISGASLGQTAVDAELQFTTVDEATASRTFNSNGAGTLTVSAEAAGSAGNAFQVEFVAGVGNGVNLSAAIDANTNVITVTLGTDAGGALDATKNDIDDIAAAIDALAGVAASTDGGAGSIAAAAAAVSLEDGADEQQITFTGTGLGAAGNNVTVEFVQGANGAATSVAVNDADPNDVTITFTLSAANGNVTETTAGLASFLTNDAGAAAAREYLSATGTGATAIGNLANNALAGGTDGASLRLIDAREPGTAGTVSIALTDPGVASQGLSVTVNGNAISVSLATDGAGNITSTLDDIAAALAGSDAAELATFSVIGDGASVASAAAATDFTEDGGDLVLESQNYGTNEFVEVNVLNGTFNTTLDDLTTARGRDNGVDIGVIINGQNAQTSGLEATVRTGSLDATLNFNETSNAANSNAVVTVTGGGSLFQIGQQASVAGQVGVGIEAVNTARLGGVAGKLFELGSGGGKSLLDVGPSVQGSVLVDIVEQALDRVSTLRGRLGALQKNVIETNISTLGVALENISDARSSIVDTDFAEETANLTKGQILSQAGISVLAIANQNPSQVLSLLG